MTYHHASAMDWFDIVVIKLRLFIVSLCCLPLTVMGSDVATSDNLRQTRDVLRDKLVGIYTTFQLKESIIQGCDRLDNDVSKQLKQAFTEYGAVAKEYIDEGKRLLTEELSAVDAMEWKAILADSQKYFQSTFSQMSVSQLTLECQQLTNEMNETNKRVITLKKQ